MTLHSSRHVMQIIDSLQPGGAERVAVNLSNQLHRYDYRGFLCHTRQSGSLEALVEPEVVQLSLQRRHRLDLAAVVRLAQFIRQNSIGIVHAHSSSLLIARAAITLARGPCLIWHDHYGGVDARPVLPYKLAARGISGVIAVNSSLAEWAVDSLAVPRERVWYVPNFTLSSATTKQPFLDPPGEPGMRIVCVANHRPQKGHLTLLQAMERVVQQLPRAHLLLAGAPVDPNCTRGIHNFIQTHGLRSNVTVLGSVEDVPALLRVCDVGALSSVSEGLPLALLEFGTAGLACVATAVGQCPAVLAQGAAGILVQSGSSEQLAQGLLLLLQSPELRSRLGAKLKAHVEVNFGADNILRRIIGIYTQITAATEGHPIENRR